MSLDKNNNSNLYQHDESLYCSACLMPCSITNFYSHITKDHKVQSTMLSWGKFSTPVLLPGYHAEFPKKAVDPPKEPVHPEIEEGKAKPNPCAMSGKQLQNPTKFDCQICTASYLHSDYLLKHLRLCHNMEMISPPMYGYNPINENASSLSAVNNYSNPTTLHTELIQRNTSSKSINTPNASSDATVVNPADLPDESDPNLFCRVCDKKYTRLAGFRVHIRRVHNMKLKYDEERTFLHPDILPDVNDPTLYCGACEKQFINGKTYVTHIRFVHSIPVTSKDSRRVGSLKNSELRGISDHNKPPVKHRRAIFGHHIVPDPDDPVFYCGSCDRRYRKGLTAHLQKYHGYSVTQGDDFVCVLCTDEFETRDDYAMHLQQDHNKGLAKRMSMDDFTCRLCRTVYISRRDLSNHLVHIHQLKSIVGFETIPFSDSRNQFACSFCNKIFCSRSLIGDHMEHDHNVVFIYDSIYYYCNLCGNCSKSETVYRKHLIKIHKICQFPSDDTDMKQTTDFEDIKNRKVKRASHKRPLQRTRRRSSNLNLIQKPDKLNCDSDRITDISDPPTVHCQICNLTYNTSVHYRLHCFKYHNS